MASFAQDLKYKANVFKGMKKAQMFPQTGIFLCFFNGVKLSD